MLKIKTYIGLVGLDQQLQHFPNNETTIYLKKIFQKYFKKYQKYQKMKTDEI